LRAAERANEGVDVLLDELRAEPDIEKRRALFRSGGKVIGDFIRATDALVRTDPLRQIHKPFMDKAAGTAISTALDLCQWELETGDGAARSGDVPTTK
jgi:hypothetical protein